MTLGQAVEVGPFTFTVIRILAVIGAIRVILRREWLTGGLSRMDSLMLLWSSWALLSSAFHDDVAAALISRLGMVYNACAVYFLIRTFCKSIDDVVSLCKLTAIALIPVAAEMTYEHIAFRNLFSILGGVSETPMVRDGKIRALGPFAHPILAGTVGAVCFPIMMGIWRENTRVALAGMAACLTIVFLSASSGPVMSLVAGIGAVVMWCYRDHMRRIRWLAIGTYVALDAVMNAPAYYIMGRLDITGSSTGYHRAALIESAMRHLDEWWLSGTDYTRHWMPTGVTWSPDHTDITNHYLSMGVTGGLLLVALFIAILASGFRVVGETVQAKEGVFPEYHFVFWTLGAALFTHCVTAMSVSYFDQSFLFLYLTLAMIDSASVGAKG
jgi:hypothetical protein